MKIVKTNPLRNLFSKLFILFIAIISTFIFPKIGWFFADLLSNKYGYKQFSFFWDVIHHLVQIIPVFIIISLPIFKKSYSDWGLNNKNKELSKTIIIKFALGFLVFFIIGKSLFLLIYKPQSILDFNPSLKSIWQVIIFRFIFPGLSEEILFRSYLITLLMISWKKIYTFNTIEIPFAGIIAAILFSIAHIGISLYPFKITYYDPIQLFFAFSFGIYYSVIFYKTKSIIAPIITHNIIDGGSTLIDFLFSIILGK